MDSDDHDLLIRMNEQLILIRDVLDDGVETDKAHDCRLRRLEEDNSKIMSYVIMIGGVAGATVHGILWFASRAWK